MMDKKTTTLESVVRSPRFLGLTKVDGHWEATFVGAFNDGGDVAVTVEAPDCDGVITAAALRISALDTAEWHKRPPLSDAEALAIHEEIFGEWCEDYDDEEQREIADEMRAILAADTDAVAEMRAKYRGAK